MAEIIQFPNAADQDWMTIRHAITETLKVSGLDNNAIDWICNDVKPRLFALKLERSFSAPPGCEQTIKEIVEFIHEISNHALLELLKLEVAFYQAKFAG
jgi:hypothetical protein